MNKMPELTKESHEKRKGRDRDRETKISTAVT
jgi:hypothetical protein